MLLLFAYSEEEKRVCFSVGMGANVSRACSSNSDKIRIVRILGKGKEAILQIRIR